MSTQIQITPKSGITVGTTPITSGTDTRVLFQDGSTVGQDADITWNKTTNKLTLGASTYLQGGSSSLDSFATGWGLYNCGLRSTLSGAGNGIWNVSEISIGMASPSAKLDVKAGGALSTDLAFRVRNSADTLNILEVRGDKQIAIRDSLSIGDYYGGNTKKLYVYSDSTHTYAQYIDQNLANSYGSSIINRGTGAPIGLSLSVYNGTTNTALQIVNGNIEFGTTTGTKIGMATTQKLSFWNATPIVQPTTSIASATLASLGGTALTDTDTFDGYTLKQIVKALRNSGLLQ